MKKVFINGNPFNVHNLLDGFNLFQKQSSNVDFFGTDRNSHCLFVQFKSGSFCYMYSDVPDKILTWAENAESIGKFISSEVVGKFQHIKMEGKLIKAVPATQSAI